jgi:hypothetical protein
MDKQFALVLAGQVSAGLTRGDDELHRARAALLAIGLMVLNASGNDELVAETLAISDHAIATVSGDGLSVTYTPEDSLDAGIDPL